MLSLAPSRAERFYRCTLSPAMEKDLPDQPSGAHAVEGIFAHAICDYALKKKIKPSRLEKRLLNRSLPFDVRNGSEVSQLSRLVTDDMLEHISVYVKYIYKKTKYEGVKSEQQVAIYKSEDIISQGFCDCHFVKNKTLYVIDYKHGAGIDVPIHDNSQLILYAIGLYNLYKATVKKVKIVIIQPRTTGIKEQTFSAKEIEEKEIEFLRVVKTIRGKPELSAGPHCRWCKAQSRCFAKWFDYSQISSTEARSKLISSGQFIDVLNNISSIREFLKTVESEAFNLLNSGSKIPGWKIVSKRESRKWKIEQDKLLSILKREGYKKKQICKPREMLPLTAMEKIVDPKILNPLITKESSGVTMVPESDPRQAVTQAEIDFSEGE